MFALFILVFANIDYGNHSVPVAPHLNKTANVLGTFGVGCNCKFFFFYSSHYAS